MIREAESQRRSDRTRALSRLESALEYARRGWAVLPLYGITQGRCKCGNPNCSSPGKHPLRQLVPHGLREASASEQDIRAWWTCCPWANVGIRTGKESGIVVIDVDGGGEETLKRLQDEHGPFPETLTSRTGSGGRHLLFEHPGEKVANKVKESGLGPGLDVRGDGGYIVAPPSAHIAGGYGWMDAGTPIAPMPEWLCERLCDPDRSEHAPHTPRRPPPSHDGNGTAYGKKALEEECTVVGRAIKGSRNDTLNKAAYSIGQLVGGGEIDQQSAEEGLCAAALGTGLPEQEVRATLRSGLEAGMKQPRTAPDVAGPRIGEQRPDAPQDPAGGEEPTDPAWEAEDGKRDDAGATAAPDSSGSKSMAQLLIPIVLDREVEFFHDQRGDTYAAVPEERGRRIQSIKSRAFGEWLSHLVWNELGRAMNSEQQSSVRTTLSGMARFGGDQHDLHVRVAAHEGAFWLDLDGLRAVRVVPGRWDIVDDPPILFRPPTHQKPLPEPVRGGDPKLLWPFVNLLDHECQVLLLCYLVAAMVPEIPVAALVVHGVQGSAKTTFLRMVKSLLDPSIMQVHGPVRGQDDYALAAFKNRVLFFDNLSSIPDWLSDAMCRTVTGEGWEKRSLYTDDDTTVFQYKRVVGFSGINLVADRADLLDRSLIMELEPLSPAQRMEEHELWSEFNAARPQVLGGLLDALAKAMQVEPGLSLPSHPRMADFARWGAAAAVGLGFNPRAFLDAYDQNVERQNEAALAGSPVAQALMLFMKDRPDWRGSPAELHAELLAVAGEHKVDTRSKSWPKSSSWLSRRLKEVQPNLLAMGIDVKVGEARAAGLREITVTAMPSRAGNAVMGQTETAQGDSGP